MTEFSVVIPMHDVEEYIGPCLESLVAQEGAAWEAVVVDDGSTDGSVRAVRSVQAACPGRIRLVRQGNLGAYEARRAGYLRAAGARILSLDADDELAPGALERVGELMDRTGADVLMFNACVGAPGGRRFLRYPSGLVGETFAGDRRCELWAHLAGSDDLNNMSTKAFSRGLVERMPRRAFAASMRIGEDAVQATDLLCAAGSVHVCDEPLYVRRVRAGSATSTFGLGFFDDLRALAEFLSERFEGRVDGCDALVRRHYAATFCRYVRQASAAGALTRDAFARISSDGYARAMLAGARRLVGAADRPLLAAVESGSYARVWLAALADAGARSALRRMAGGGRGHAR